VTFFRDFGKTQTLSCKWFYSPLNLMAEDDRDETFRSAN
jgi:hypothetical protein